LYEIVAEVDNTPGYSTAQFSRTNAKLEVTSDRTAGNARSHRHSRDAGYGDSRIKQSVTPPLDRSGRISFYDKGAPYYEFTNFSNHSVWYNEKEYASSEHLFQSLKFEDAADAERVRLQRSPRAAFEEAQRMHSRIRRDWIDDKQNIKAMNKVLLLKFTQHEYLRKMLLDTDNAELVEASPIDSFWGTGADGRGQNQLGIALMHVRHTLRVFES